MNVKTTQGVSFAMKAVNVDGGLKTELKGTYKNGPATVEVVANEPKATVSVAHTIFEGLKVTIAGSAPKLENTGKLTVDYAHPYFNSKASVSLNANPVLDVAAAAGYSGLIVGATASVDVTSSKAPLKKWAAAVAYQGPEFVVSGHVSDGLDVIRGTYWQELDASSTVGAEVTHKRAKNAVDLTLGYSHVNAAGDMTKVKLGNDGMLQGLYEYKPRRDTTVSTSVSLNALDTATAPKFGIAVEHTP